jgi:DamX protein
MAVSELNNRLDFLVSYSSQLVFVCIDKIKPQSQVVENFLDQQSHNAELALLTAKELTPLVTYREKIYRQLVNDSQIPKLDFNRPLNQLLAPLNNQHGAILISIYQAEKLPNKLVKELWELVLQSRFANNKHHINVLLMGESTWAEETKLALSAHSKEKPILLNSQDDMEQQDQFSHQSLDDTDLDTFIHNKRQKFAQRVKDRNQTSYLSQPIYKKWWMMLILTIVFLSVFGGILWWQYPNQVAGWLSLQDQLTANEVVSAKQATSNADNKITAAPIEMATANTQLTNPIIITAAVKLNQSLANNQDRLVTDWQTALAKIDEKSILTKRTKTKNNVELPEEVATSNKVAVQLDTPEFAIAKPNIGVLSIPESLTTDFVTNTQELMALPKDHFVIQIAATIDMTSLQEYIKTQQLTGKLWLYSTQRNGSDWHVLVNNQHFPSITLARSQIADLPESMQVNTPFVKSIRQIQQEISVSSL